VKDLAKKDRVERIWLVGMMGSGKSTVGAALAARLGWEALDTDTLIERQAGERIVDLWRREGEAVFRAQEAEVIAQVVAGEDRRVVSVGGGAVLDPGNRAQISSSGFVVWLRADPTTLLARVGAGAERPALGGDPVSTLARIDAGRRAFYGEVADLVVDVDGVAPADAARTIISSAEGALVRA
jgi:shikimate kinase